MKAFGFWVLFLLIDTGAFLYLECAARERVASSNPGMSLANSRKAVMKSRKLKENIKSENVEDPGRLQLEDYRPIDPVPSSKASINHGPIQHATPLLPFIPKPPPPQLN